MTQASSLYDAQIDLSTGDGGLSRDTFKDWMRVRLFGSRVRRAISIPVLTGSVFFVNDCGDDVQLRRGAAAPVTVGAGEIVHVMFDGSPAGMRVAR